MQSETLNLFVDDINDIREYIKYIKLVNNIEVSTLVSSDNELVELRDHLRNFGVSKKIFEYKSITISLYGILEKHIGIWIKEYINQLPRIITNYNDLPDKFREDHFNLSVKLIGLIGEKRHSKYEDMKKESILAKLSSCIEKPDEFQLNTDAFYIRSGNLKHVKIAEALTYLDIKLTSSLKVIGQRSEGFLCDRAPNIGNKGDELFRLIDELVDRRNDIAHGEDVDNILNISEFSKYVDFLEGYGRAVFQTLIEKINQLEATYLYTEIDNVIDIYRKGSVLCFEIANNEICIGDNIIVNLLDGGFIKKEILGIQKNNEDFIKLAIKEPEAIGINVGNGISKGQTFFIKKSS